MNLYLISGVTGLLLAASELVPNGILTSLAFAGSSLCMALSVIKTTKDDSFYENERVIENYNSTAPDSQPLSTIELDTDQTAPPPYSLNSPGIEDLPNSTVVFGGTVTQPSYNTIIKQM